MPKSLLAAAILMVISTAIIFGQQTESKPRDIPVEVLQVLGLPLNVHEAVLTSNGFDYFVRLRISNETSSELRGFRYALKPIDPRGGVHNGWNPNEVITLAPNESQAITFKAARIRMDQTKKYRFVLMVEQVISSDSIWEVIKSKDTLDAYLKGDYSVQPIVMRVANAVDAPPQTRVIY